MLDIGYKCLAIFGPKVEHRTLEAARLPKWKVILAAYICSLEYRPTTVMGRADALLGYQWTKCKKNLRNVFS